MTISQVCFLIQSQNMKLEKQLNDLKSNKSCGYDGVNSKIIKLLAKQISRPLTHIFNLSFTTGIIPEDLKIALITPIFKGNNENRFD